MTLSDRLLLSMFLGVEVNAVYAVAKKIPNLLTAVQSTFSLAWQENASLSVEDSDIDSYYSRMFSLVFDLVIGSCAVLIGISPLLFALLIRGDYMEAYCQMPMLSVKLSDEKCDKWYRRFYYNLRLQMQEYYQHKAVIMDSYWNHHMEKSYGEADEV